MENREALNLDVLDEVVGGAASTRNYMVSTRNGKSLNFRRTMKTHCNNRICNIPNNARLVVRQFLKDGWAEVEYNHMIGYVKSEFITPAAK